ncbi:MAG: glycosyltransferase involved in cell wall biosynthesis [Planctomycetota bacterium]|jgi:glycosyltransferase involved in cell wall biosynthesis
MGKSVYIVMAVHNGQRYLAEQLDSLLAQTFCDWTLLVRDDGSTDGSFEIMADYIEKHPQIEVLQDKLGNLGAKTCFSVLLLEALNRNADYVACCDQDDVWLPGKLQNALEVMLGLERSRSSKTPFLVHTDLQVVNASLKLLNNSFMRFSGIRQTEDVPLCRLLVQNHVVGCTMLVNRTLLEVALPVPEHARMHDWWLALCARSSGSLCFIDSAEIKYRQHSDNTLGATGFMLAFHFMSRAWRDKWRKWQSLQPVILSQIREVCEWAEQNEVADANGLTWRELRRVYDKQGLVALGCAWRAGLQGQRLPVTVLFYVMFLFRKN